MSAGAKAGRVDNAKLEARQDVLDADVEVVGEVGSPPRG
jgi:hypothetical protein